MTLGWVTADPGQPVALKHNSSAEMGTEQNGSTVKQREDDCLFSHVLVMKRSSSMALVLPRTESGASRRHAMWLDLSSYTAVQPCGRGLRQWVEDSGSEAMDNKKRAQKQ